MRMKSGWEIFTGILLIAGLLSAIPVAAGERESLEQLRNTTMSLIELLVQEGVLSKAKADELIHQAELARQAAEEKEALTRAESPEAQSAQVADGDKIVRVQYVPEHVKKELREEIKKEVMAKAQSEGWAYPGSIPEWLNRIEWTGDLRLRYEKDLFQSVNETPANLALQGININNTSEDRNRYRLRARLGAKINISDSIKGGIRFVTGAVDDPVSPNQTFGNTGNKFSFALDQAYLSYQPVDWLTFTGGRMSNPWVSTDLVWDPDFNFDGITASFKPAFNQNLKGFATVGAFPIQEVEASDTVLASDKWLYGAQTGIEWTSSNKSTLKLAGAYYDFKNVQGVANEVGFRTHDKTAPQFRQKGNTVYDINAANFGDPTLGGQVLGLASEFRLINLNATLDIAAFNPFHVVLTGDYVKNIGFNETDVTAKAALNPGSDIGGDTGWMGKVLVGIPETVRRNDWNIYGAYKYLETNAVLDAFSDSDFRLGGTNAKGWLMGANYGLDKNTWLSVRWFSADEIVGSPLSIDVLLVDLNAKF